MDCHPVISVQQETPDNDFLSFQHFTCTFWILGIFSKPEKLGTHTRSKWWPDDPVTQTWKMTQMTHWPGDPMTQFHVWPELTCSKSTELHDASIGHALQRQYLIGRSKTRTVLDTFVNTVVNTEWRRCWCSELTSSAHNYTAVHIKDSELQFSSCAVNSVNKAFNGIISRSC